MADRYAQFQERIKMIVDKSDAEKEVYEFVDDIKDILQDVKVGLDAKSLKEVGDTFNAKLKELGKTPIIFSDIAIDNNALKEITTRFMRAIGDGIRAGVQGGVEDALAEIARLEKSKAPHTKKRSELMSQKTRLSSTISARENKDNVHPHPMKKNGDINEQARQIYQEFKDAKRALIDLYEDLSVSDADYQKAEDRFYDSVNNLYRMRQTMKDYMDEVTDKSIKKKFKFSNLNDAVDEAFIEVDLPSLEDSDGQLAKYEEQIADIDKILVSIDNHIQEIKNNNKDILDKEMIDGALKSLVEVEKAIDRIRNKTNKKEVNKHKLDMISSAVDYDPAAENNKNILGTLSKRLSTARQDGAGWEEEYQWIVKFVKQYKYLQESGNLTEHLQKQYGPLFSELVGMAENAETSLRMMIDYAQGKIPKENPTDAADKLRIEKEHVLAAEQQVDAKQDEADAAARLAAAEKKAKEEAEARVRAEKEMLEIKEASVRNERLLSDLSSTSNLDKEKFAYLNTDTGNVSPHIVGEYGQVSKKSQQELLESLGDSFNSTLHTHPELVAAPSENDIKNFANNYASFKKNFILAGEQLAEIDFTGLSETQAQELADKYKQNVLNSEEELYEKFNYTSFKDLGVKSLNIEGILNKTSEYLMAQFPELQVDINNYIKNLRSMFQGVKTEDLSQDQLEGMLDDVMGNNFKNTSNDLKSDIYQATLDTINHASGIPSMYQEALRDIFTQTIRDLNFDPSQILKLHNVNDFDAQLMTMRQQSTIAYQENAAAVKEATAAQKKLSQNIPSEDEIKGGKASWRGVPIKYDASLPGEARNLTDFMKVGPKFFGMDAESQKSILDHEVAHNIADRIMDQATDEWEKVADIFAPKKLLPKGANPSFYTEEDDKGNRWYREGLYGDLGATALSETLTHALTEYFSNPDAFKKRDEGAFNYLEEYLNKSGDTLDNVGAVKDEIAAQKELNAAKQEEQQIEQQVDTVAADNQKKIESYEELTDAVKKYIDLKSQLKRMENTNEDWYWDDIGNHTPEGVNDDATNVNEIFQSQWKKVVAIRKSIKEGADAYIDPELKTAVKIGEDTFEREEKTLKQLITGWTTFDISKLNEAQKKYANKVLDSFKAWEQDWQNRYNVSEEYNKPIEEQMNKIRDNIAKQSSDANLVWNEFEFDRDGKSIIDTIAPTLGIEIPQAAETAKQEVDELVASLEKVQQIEQTPSNEVVETRAEVAAQAELNEELKETAGLKEKIEAASKGGTHGQSLADVSRAMGTGVSADIQELQKVLSTITYNVKIINDDTDKTANKIALDDSTLEATLNKVFANILNPVTEQNDEDNQEPWALEKTLNTTIKSVLDQIQTNTSKIGTAEVTTIVDDGVLTAIKQAVESINKKIVQGTKVIKTGDKKEPEKKDNKPEIKKATDDGFVKATKVDTRVKELQRLYEQRGKLLSQQSFESSKETQEEINQLNKLIQFKFKELKLEDAKKSILKQSLMTRQEEAKQSEKAILAAREADKAAKQKAKDEKAALRAEMKDVRDKSRVAKSASTWRSGKDTYGMTMNMVDDDNNISIDDVMDHETIAKLNDSLNDLAAIQEKVNKQIKDNKPVTEEDAVALQKQTAATQQQISAVKELQKNYEFFSGENSASLNQTYTGGNLEEQLKQAITLATNGKAKFGEYDATLGRWTYTVKGANNTVEHYTAGLRGLDNQLRTVHTSTKKTEGLLEAIGRKVKEVFTYFSGSSIIYKVFGWLKQGIQYIREIDSALVELRKVTDKTEEEYDKFLKTAAKTADKLGSTISAVTEATATFAKLGYEMEMAAEMAEAAIVYKNVGDNIASTEDAANSIISTLKGFGLEASESMRIVDRFNEVGNRFAITSQGIGEALRLSASALNEGGNTLDESIGIITAANEVVNDPSSVGTALKTLTLRLRGSKTELEEMGEDVSDMATTTSQLQAKLLALTGGKVDIMLDANTFKSSTQILREMADAWEDMNDISRASALELMGGKRQANVLSALITNFDTAEKAIEASANSAGSALRENEVYLDSIQGRIDQFTNSVQTMWQNTLNSDVIKWFVDIGTAVIKLIDGIGLVGSALIALSVISMIKNKAGIVGLFANILKLATSASEGIVKLGQGIKSVFTGDFSSILEPLKDLVAEQASLQASTLATEFNTKKLTAAQLGEKVASMQLTGSIQTLNVAEMQRAFSTTSASDAQLAATIQSLGLDNSLKALTATEVQNALATAGVAEADITAIMAALGLTGANQGLAASFKVLLASMAPLLIVAGIGLAIWGVVAIFDALIKTTDELKEELDGLKSELQDIQSELDSVNSELETTQDRMAELLAMPSLSFTEQEELELLRKQNDELQRQLDLLELKKKQQQNEMADTFVELMNSDVKSAAEYDQFGHKREWYDWVFWWGEGAGDAIAGLGTEEQHIEDQLKKYTELRSQISNTQDEEEKNKLIKEAEEIEAYINQKTTEWAENAEGLDYFVGDDLTETQKQTNEWLDYINSIQDKWAIISGDDNAKTNAIKRIFNKDEFSGVSDEINKLVAELKKDPTNQTIIDQIRSKCLLAEDDLKAVGLSAKDAMKYFTMELSGFDSTTVEGVTAQYVKGIEVFKKYKDAGKSANADLGISFEDHGIIKRMKWQDLFDEDGNTIDTRISELLKGADETARKEFARLAKSVNEGKITVEQAMKTFSAKGLAEGWKLVEAQVSEINADVFKDLGDELSGVIDTISELSAAFENVADSMNLVHQAQAEMAYSGHLSVETALQLMESTDDWNKVLAVEEGNIKLVDGAEQILIQTKLDLIRQNLETALSTVEAQIAEAEAGITSENLATTIEESTNLAVRQLSGNMAYLNEMMNAYVKIAAGESVNMADITKAAEDAKQAALNATAYETHDVESVNLEELYKTRDGLKMKISLLDTVDTPSEFGSNYSSNDVSGDTGTKEDAEDKKTEEGWEALINKYENKLALITNERDLIQAEIDKAEARGGKASAQYYEDLIRNSNEEKALLEEKKGALETYLEANKNNIDSETWTEYNNEINETAVAIKECETNTIEWAEALREIDIHYFEQATDEISRLGEELDFVNGSLEDEDVADENGNWSDAGITRLGLYTQQMEKAAAEAKMYKDEIDELNTQYANGELSEEQYQERLSELVSGQQDAIQSYEDAKDGIVELNEARIDAIKEGIEKEIEAYEDYIDVVKESLDAERDLYDFKKNVQKQTKDIAALERRIASLSGSTNASDIAERRKLQAELNEAQEGLNDTYYDHSKDQQSQALDDESEAFSKSKEKYIEELEATLDDVETLITNSIMDVMLNADTVLTQLNEISTTYGVDLSTALKQPWVDAYDKATAWKDELKNSMTAGEYAALIGEGGAITAFANGVATKLQGSWTSAKTAAQGYADFLTGTELGNKFSSTITGFGNQIQLIIDKWNGVKQAADAAYTAQTRQVDVGGNHNAGNDNGGNGGDNSGGGDTTQPTGNVIDTDVERLQAILNQFFGAKLDIDGKYGPATTAAVKAMQAKIGDIQDGLYTAATKAKLQAYLNKLQYANSFFKDDPNLYVPPAIKKRDTGGAGGGGGGGAKFSYITHTKYAKGTMSTSRDEWALTDEIGDELVLVPGANGNLSFMRKGTSVVPADLTANLVEWGKLNPNMLNVGGGANINMISNAVTKPELNFEFDSLVHVDNCSQETLKDLEKMVDNKINQFSKQMNYAIKRIGGR